MKRIVEILALIPGTLVWGGLVVWGTVATAVNRVISFNEDSHRFGRLLALVGSLGEFLMFALPSLGLVVIWCLVLGWDSWIHRRPKLRMVLALNGLLVGAILTATVFANLIEDYRRTDSILLGLAGGGLIVVGATYLWRLVQLCWRAEQNREPHPSLRSERLR